MTATADAISSTAFPTCSASTGNYLAGLGWRRGEPWLTEVRLPANLPWDQADLTIELPRTKWAAYGVTFADGQPLPADNLPASLLLPMGRFGPAFLAYKNFQVYLQWNNSLVYSTTAAYLATRIDGAPALHRGAPPPALSFNDVKAMQGLLGARRLRRRRHRRIFGAENAAGDQSDADQIWLACRFLSDGGIAGAHALSPLEIAARASGAQTPPTSRRSLLALPV